MPAGIPETDLAEASEGTLASNIPFSRLRKEQRFYGHRVKQEETSRINDDFVDLISETPPTCVHGHLMRTLQEIGGTCYCGAWLCLACSQRRCALCDRMVCRDHCEISGDRVCCLQHNGMRRFLFIFAGVK